MTEYTKKIENADTLFRTGMAKQSEADSSQSGLVRIGLHQVTVSSIPF